MQEGSDCRPNRYLSIEEIGDKQRDNLLGELVRAKVIGGPCDDDIQPVCLVCGLAQQIRRRLQTHWAVTHRGHQ